MSISIQKCSVTSPCEDILRADIILKRVLGLQISGSDTNQTYAPHHGSTMEQDFGDMVCILEKSLCAIQDNYQKHNFAKNFHKILFRRPQT